MSGAVGGDRRPIKSRDTALAQRFASWLVAHRVSPDAISLFGMVAGLAAGACLWSTVPWSAGERWLFAAAALAIQVRLLCNLFDGMVAIGSGRASPVGELYNDLPDRVSDSAVLIGLGLAGGCPWLGCAAALLAMATAYVRTLGKALGAGSDFGGPMAKQQRMFVVTLAALFMALAPAAWRPALSGLGLPGLALVVIVVGSAWTVVRRLRNVARQLRGGSR
ncbi:MAG: CDP-alcohol phosphatidyltransferase family protein [Planctomycetota bacterium]